MAEFTTIFFPNDEQYLPSSEGADKARSLLEEAYLGDYAIEIKQTAGPHLIESGADFSSLVCPACQAVVKWRDNPQWWWEILLESLNRRSAVQMSPCCDETVDLKRFDFRGNVAYAKFSFHVESAGQDVAPDENQIQMIEAAFGSELCRIIQAMD